MKILLLEDDLLLNEIVEEHLELKGNIVTSVYSGDEAEDLAFSETFDLFIFDVNVPNINGFDLLKEIREKEIRTPAIFITSANMLEDMEKGFESGCDDYIKKPFELKELDLRIDNIKRLYDINPLGVIEISENIKIDMQNLILIKDNKKIHLPQKECEVLGYLVKNKQKPVSIDELSLNIWAYEDAPNSSTIRTYMKNIRKVLGEEYIINIRGVGYKFNSK
ncbi:MAG: DNA-binding response regulator [Arcobacter sp.]|nr:DNA-binding response regulator [Arcobacter sp.]|tara:strand:+ start:41 stop:703 length:663 start_codon:yes stop_codon:yes gene_type:complete